MVNMPWLQVVSPLDWFALSWFVMCWVGYGWMADSSAFRHRGLVGIGHQYRLRWAQAMVKREVRVHDAALMGNLMSSISFYANTTIYIVAGLFALLGTLDKVVSVTEDLPFARAVSSNGLELKVLVLIATFVIAYFKFSWSLRQFNLLNILMGAAPPPGDPTGSQFAEKMATVNTLAGDEFNGGIRAYYFGIAAVTWMIAPWLFIAVTSLVLWVLYRRDFKSKILEDLR